MDQHHFSDLLKLDQNCLKTIDKHIIMSSLLNSVTTARQQRNEMWVLMFSNEMWVLMFSNEMWLLMLSNEKKVVDSNKFLTHLN